jgi:ABC-2 type transport system permease protein
MGMGRASGARRARGHLPAPECLPADGDVGRSSGAIREVPGQGFPAQVRALVVIQLSNWRWSWQQMLITGMMAPLVTVVGLGLYADDNNVSEQVYVLSGAICMALLFEMQNRIAGNFSFMKNTGAFDFYAALPVRRESLVLATLTAFSMLALPAVAVTIVVGSWILGLAPVVSWMAIPGLLLCLLTPAFLGAWLGSRSSSLEEASSTSLALTIAMLVCGPVAVSAERLPQPLVVVGYLNPAAHAAAVIREVLFGIGGGAGALALHLAALTVFSVLGWVWMRLRMDWRAARR